jgi:hypothetical protein
MKHILRIEAAEVTLGNLISQGPWVTLSTEDELLAVASWLDKPVVINPEDHSEYVLDGKAVYVWEPKGRLKGK